MKDETKHTDAMNPRERDARCDIGEADSHGGGPSALSRRQFLEAAGFTASLVAINGCGRAPVVTALPYAVQPEGVVPGRTLSYASTCSGCPSACGLLVAVRDGRPLKMEGMPEHPMSQGGTCAIGQAQPLGLYDSHRLKQPLISGEPEESWEKIDEAIGEQLTQLAENGRAVRFVTSTVTSPTLQTSIDKFLGRFDDAKHVVFDAVSSSAILDAHQETHAVRLLPHYRLDKASVIVSFGADFLGTWISPVEFTAAWRSRRVPTEEHREMSYHVQLEGRLSLTGSNADNRYRLTPDEYGTVLSHLAVKLAEHAGQPAPSGTVGLLPIAEADLEDLAKRLWDARGQSIVLSDSQDVAVQKLVNQLNHTLGNYGETLDIERPSRQRQSDDKAVLQLVEDLKAGLIGALFVAGTDLTHNLPDRDALAKTIEGVPLVVSFAERVDDFTSLAKFTCPDHHALESWLDAEPISGLVSLTQPTVLPLGETRSILESLAQWSGQADTAYNILQASWKQNILPRAGAPPFQSYWDKAVHDGYVEIEPAADEIGEFKTEAVQLMASPVDQRDWLTLYSKVGLTDSRHAHNPWLQELPDPITKVTWDNYVCVSPAMADKKGLFDGDIVQIAIDNLPTLELPAFRQPGQHDRVVAVALGYGVRGTERFANIGPEWIESRPTVQKDQRVGENAAGFIQTSSTLQYHTIGVTLTKQSGRRNVLASTQTHHSLHIPPNVAPPGAKIRTPIIQETTLAEFQQDPTAGTITHLHPEPHGHAEPHPEEEQHEAEPQEVEAHSAETQEAAESHEPTETHNDDESSDATEGVATEHATEAHSPYNHLWDRDHDKSRQHWGMVIDLNACTGCSACLIACQAENNVPVVGKDEVRRRREMHWIRIDRYYSGDDDDLDVSHQPMMCQHCDNAPCETVCPVLATVHGEGGLNQQAYNRCVGTRYCANNCPYKVRRFNWFKYEHDDLFQNLAFNPDVTVRSRGVMEKCSMCVQRIENGKIEANRLGIPLADGAIQTACQQSCPAQAITFGNMKDAQSQVTSDIENPRHFRVLEEFNFLPSVGYLRAVRNRDAETHEEGSDHV